MTCEHCQKAATNYAYGGIDEHCEGCRIRKVANWPKHLRQQEYSLWARLYGEDEMQRRRLAVVAEYKRIDELRGNHG